ASRHHASWRKPLLLSKARFVEMMHEFDRVDAAGIKTRRKCQTNAVLLNDEWVRLLTQWRIQLGISLDGPKLVHDMYRVDHAGRGSYDGAVRGLQRALAAEADGLRTSVLCFINPM